MAVTKYYHYSVWVENDVGHRLNPADAFSDSVFTEEFHPLPDRGDKSYALRLRKIDPGRYHGMIVRTKGKENFFTVDEEGSFQPFKDLIEGGGRVTNAELDCVDFAIQIEDTGLSLLVEVGFQTPGIGVIKRYLREHMKDRTEHKLRHGTKLDDSEGELSELLDKSLKKAEISFKKNPESYEHLSVDDRLRNVAPDDYRLKFEISLERGMDTRERKVREYLSHVNSMLGFGEGPVEDSIERIDFPRIMHMFKITPVEGGEENEEEAEDIADMILRERIDTSGYGMFDADLGARLCDIMRQE